VASLFGKENKQENTKMTLWIFSKKAKKKRFDFRATAKNVANNEVIK